MVRPNEITDIVTFSEFIMFDELLRLISPNYSASLLLPEYWIKSPNLY